MSTLPESLRQQAELAERYRGAGRKPFIYRHQDCADPQGGFGIQFHRDPPPAVGLGGWQLISPAGDLTAYRVTMADGSSYVTSMARHVTLPDAQAYFVGQHFEQPDGSLLRAVAVAIV